MARQGKVNGLGRSGYGTLNLDTLKNAPIIAGRHRALPLETVLPVPGWRVRHPGSTDTLILRLPQQLRTHEFAGRLAGFKTVPLHRRPPEQ